MFVRAVAIALCLAAPILPAFALAPIAPQEQQAAMTIEELMSATALDQLFNSFAETIAASPEQQGLPVPATFLSAWKQTANDVFVATEMHDALARSFEGKFTDIEMAELATFFRSDFGKRITGVESAVQELSAEDQLAARDEGIMLLEDMPADARRSVQLDEILELVSAEVGRAMLGQAMRAMLMSMAVAGATGDIVVPWEEIDAQLAQILPGVEAEVAMTQRAIIAYAYQEISDEDMETYLQFLRTDASRKFYAVLGLNVGLIMEKTMIEFGQELARRLNRVNV
jgi:hypothetical protein